MLKKYIIGIDLGGTNLKVALLDFKYKIRGRKNLNTREFTRKEELISAIVDSIHAIIADNKLAKKDILGLGLGLPGPVDSRNGIVHFFPNIPGWKNVGLKKNLSRKLGLPVFLDNDANLMTLAEYRLGAAKGFNNVVCLTLGTGVGGGIVINGKIYRGHANAGGEIGHMPVNADGPRCNCGGYACLESYIGNNRILKEARGIFKRNITLEEASELARTGNKKAQGLWIKMGRYLGVTLSGIVNLLNPECIVIGGGLAKAGRILFDEVRKTIKKRAMSVQAEGVKIFEAALGNDAGFIGAAIVVKQNLAQ